MFRLIGFFCLVLLFASCEYVESLIMANSSKPTTETKLYLPKNIENTNSLPTANTYTILLFKDGKTYVYEGVDIKKSVEMKCKIGEGSLLNQQIILGKNKYGKNFSLIIKTSKTAEYKDMIDILDLMVIHKIQKYSLQDLSTEEEKMYLLAN